MARYHDRTVYSRVPFSKEGFIVFVDDSKESLGVLMGNIAKEMSARAKRAGFTFIYLPDLLSTLSADMLRYEFPLMGSSPSAGEFYTGLREIAKIRDRAGFLYTIDGITSFHQLDASTEESLSHELEDFLAFIVPSLFPRLQIEKDFSGSVNKVRPKTPKLPKARKEIEEGPMEDIVAHSIPFEEEALFDMLPAPSSVEHFEPLRRSVRGKDLSFSRLEDRDVEVEEDLPLEKKTEDILKAWREFEKKFGVSIRDLERMISGSENLSHLRITTSNRIFLSDIDGTPEVKLDDLTKALYFFYLRHPEGVAFKSLQDHETEMLRIYMGITGRDDLEGIRRTVSGLVSPFSDGRNSCSSRIKKAFKDIVGERIAEKYYIGGRQGGIRKVEIDRDLVIWDHR